MADCQNAECRMQLSEECIWPAEWLTHVCMCLWVCGSLRAWSCLIGWYLWMVRIWIYDTDLLMIVKHDCMSAEQKLDDVWVHLLVEAEWLTHGYVWCGPPDGSVWFVSHLLMLLKLSVVCTCLAAWMHAACMYVWKWGTMACMMPCDLWGFCHIGFYPPVWTEEILWCDARSSLACQWWLINGMMWIRLILMSNESGCDSYVFVIWYSGLYGFMVKGECWF